MQLQGWSVLLVGVATWYQRCVTYTVCPLSNAFFLKLCSLMHLVNTGHSPQYLRELVWHPTLPLVLDSALQAADNIRRQRLVWRSANGVSGLQVRVRAAWHSLPVSLQDILDHQAFKQDLKTELVNCVYTTEDCFLCYVFMVTYIYVRCKRRTKKTWTWTWTWTWRACHSKLELGDSKFETRL